MTMPSQEYDRDTALAELAAATERLLTTASTLTDGDVRAPSLLPGWTRGHVLAHIARNADAMRNLVAWARTGVETPMYASRESRAADIERDAPRSAAEHLRDLAETARALAEDVRALPGDRLDAEVSILAGRRFPVRHIAWYRLREVEIHHVDLGAGYTPEQWPEGFVRRVLEETVTAFGHKEGVPAFALRTTDTGRTWRLGTAAEPPTVAGPEHALFAWLCGRDVGTTLSVTPDGPLPTPPTWP